MVCRRNAFPNEQTHSFQHLQACIHIRVADINKFMTVPDYVQQQQPWLKAKVTPLEE